MAVERKFHVNNNNQVRPCSAKKCRFGAVNHYGSEEEAYQAIAEKGGFTTIPSRRKIKIELRAKPETKAAVEVLIEKGLAVSAPKSLDQLLALDGTDSEVDILQEELKGLDLAAIRKNLPF